MSATTVIKDSTTVIHYDTSMSVTATGNVATDTIWDAKGDLAVATAADTAAKLTVGTDGYVLTADSAQTTGVKWAAASGGAASTEPYVTIGNTSGLSAERALTAGAGITLTDGGANSTATVATGHKKVMATGRYLFIEGASNATSATAAVTNGRMLVGAVLVVQSCTIDRISFEVVTTPGGAGSVTRAGIYNSDANGLPSSLLLDAGTADTTTTGIKEITVSQALTPGLYWVTAVNQGAATPAATLRYVNFTTASGGAGITPWLIGTWSSFNSWVSGQCFEVNSGVTGALPSSPTFTVTNTPILVGLRLA